MTPSTNYAIRIDLYNKSEEQDIQIQNIIRFFRLFSNVLIGPIEYKKNGTPHIHLAIEYKKMSVREEEDILRTPLKDQKVIIPTKYSIKEIVITEKYSNLRQAYLYYLAYCMKGKQPLFNSLREDIQKDIPKWENYEEDTDKRTFRQYVIETYKPINDTQHYYGTDWTGQETFNYALFRDVEIQNIYQHIMSVFKRKQQLWDLGIWKKYMNLILLTYYEEYVKLKQNEYLDWMLKTM